MKHILLGFFCMLATTFISGQIASGDKLASNIAGTDINGNAFDVYADLAAGKTVVIDVFATWCGPCWSFHQSGTLEQLNTLLGPNGTDQIRVYGIEGDDTTPLSEFTDSDLGDWTAGVDYSLVNDGSFNTILKIAYFPTLYVIRPDKTVMEMGDFRYNGLIWEKAMLGTAEKDAIFIEDMVSKSFCNQTSNASAKTTIMNFGTTPITTIDYDGYINGEFTPITVQANLGVFKSTSAKFPTKVISSYTEYSLGIAALDGVEIAEEDYTVRTAKFTKPIVNSESFIVKFTTDFYPTETKLTMKDANGIVYLDETYTGDANGGGADANKEFEYVIDLENPSDNNCLTFTISDEYGDGMTAFNETYPTPGIQIFNLAGDLIKDKFAGEYDFTSTASAYAVFDRTVGAENIVEGFNFYPNPVSDFVNIEYNVKDNAEYSVFITNVLGRTVIANAKNTNYINVSQLESGIYFLNITTDNGVFAHKFTKI